MRLQKLLYVSKSTITPKKNNAMNRYVLLNVLEVKDLPAGA